MLILTYWWVRRDCLFCWYWLIGEIVDHHCFNCLFLISLKQWQFRKLHRFAFIQKFWHYFFRVVCSIIGLAVVIGTLADIVYMYNDQEKDNDTIHVRAEINDGSNYASERIGLLSNVPIGDVVHAKNSGRSCELKLFFFKFFGLTINENKNWIRLNEYDLFYTEVKIHVQTIWNFFAYIPHPHHFIIWMNYVSQTSNGWDILFSFCLSNLLSITKFGTYNFSNILNGNSWKLCMLVYHHMKIHTSLLIILFWRSYYPFFHQEHFGFGFFYVKIIFNLCNCCQ